MIDTIRQESVNKEKMFKGGHSLFAFDFFLQKKKVLQVHVISPSGISPICISNLVRSASFFNW